MGVRRLLDLLAEHGTALRWKTIVANERLKIRRWLSSRDGTLPGFSDAGAHNRNMAFQDGALQVLAGVEAAPDYLTVERAVRKLTSEPAEWFGLDAGRIAPGRGRRRRGDRSGRARDRTVRADRARERRAAREHAHG